MDEQGKVFKYKLDFYYQQALMYLVTLILYAGIRGNFIEDTFAFVFLYNDLKSWNGHLIYLLIRNFLNLSMKKKTRRS